MDRDCYPEGDLKNISDPDESLYGFIEATSGRRYDPGQWYLGQVSGVMKVKSPESSRSSQLCYISQVICDMQVKFMVSKSSELCYQGQVNCII